MSRGSNETRYTDTLPPEAISEELGPVTGGKGGNMLMTRDAVFTEAVLNEKLMAMAEFSVGRGFLLSQVAASVRSNGAKSIGLHADQNWMPAPFPAHNYSAAADNLIERHGRRMSQLLDREDALFGARGFDYSRLITTFNNAKR